MNKNVQTWVVIIIKNRYLEKQFLNHVEFPEPSRFARERKECSRCGKSFTSSTRVGNCRFHTHGAAVVDKNDALGVPVVNHEKQPFFKKQNFVWTCCGQPFLAKDSADRCDKGNHIEWDYLPYDTV